MMTLRLRQLALATAALLLVGACSDAVTGPGDSAAQLDLVSGDNQSGRIAAALESPVVVRVLSRTGRPVFGATVRFAPDADAGSVAATSVLTDSSGLAQTTWTLSASFGTKALTAFVAGVDTVRVTATAVPDRLELVSGNNQFTRAGAELTQPVVVRLVDLSGQPAVGVAVTFTPAAGNGTVVPSVVATDASGTARTVWALSATLGPKTLQVSAASATSTVTVNATATQDQLTLVSGGSQTIVAGGALPAPVVVRVLDQFGTAVPGVAVNFTPGSGSGTVSQTSVFTDNTGTASTSWTLGATPGAKALTVAAGSATPLTVSAIALSTDSIQVVSGSAQAGRAGTALPAPIVVRVRDGAGRAVQGATVTFTPDAGNGSVTATTATTDAQGQAQTTWTLGSALGAMRLVARVGATASVAVSATVTRDRLDLVSGGAQVARPGSTLTAPIVVRLTDLNGALVAGVPVTFAPGAGSVLPATVVTDASGEARTAWTLGATAGAQQLVVRSGTADSIAVVATAVRDSLALVAGGGQRGRINTALTDSVAVRVVDATGTAVSNVSITFTPSNGSVSPATATTNAQGIARTKWTLGATPGAATLTASAPGTAALVIAGTALRADSVTVVAGATQTGLAGGTLAQAVRVEVRDRTSGTLLPGVAVTFAPGAGSGTVSAGTVTTDAAGLAQTLWTLGTTTGAKSLAISTTETGSATASATATVDTSRTLVITAGNGQTGSVNATLATPLAVSVADRFGNPVAGATILWTDLLTSGVTVAASQSVTDAAGTATTTARLGVALDSALIRAKLAGRTETVTFMATTQVAMANVAVGNFFSCATTGTGSAYCWGANGNGQLGTGSLTDALDRASTPVTLGDSLAGAFPAFRSMSLGRTTACGVTLAKRLVCWGAGSGTFGSMAPMEITFTPSVTVERVAAGEGHTCFIDIDGLGWCGGENRLGQLGNFSTVETTGNAAVPVLAIAGGVPVRPRLSGVAAGRSFSCAFRRFDPTDATTRLPMCWGDNALGQLGRNSTASDSAAATVADPLAIAAFDSTSLVTGLDHACVLSTAGNAYCWGSNGYGQLGIGGAVGSGQRQLQMVAVTMPSGQTFTRLAAGEYHTCGITPAGAAYCWGRNGSGQLGDGTQTDRSTPTAVAMPGGVTFKAISLGELHSCAIAGTPPTAGSGTTASTGRVYCWGDNEYGQLGDGAASGNRSPILAPKAIVNQP